MSFARSLLSLILLLAAVAAALLGLGAHWVDGVARQREPMAAIVGPLASDDLVIQAIATELQRAAAAEIPQLALAIPGLSGELETIIATAIEQATADERVNAAWFESVDRARISLVTALDAMRVGGADAPTVWFPLDPFIALGEEKLYEVADPSFHQYLDQLQLPADLAIPLGRLDSAPAHQAANALGYAGHWRLHFLLAAALGVAGLLAGSRRGRWVAWLLAAGGGVAALFAARTGLGFVPVPPADSLSGAIQGRIISGSVASVNGSIDTALLIGYAALALGAIALIITAAFGRERTPG